jgi:FixJ family two-component response regulator
MTIKVAFIDDDESMRTALVRLTKAAGIESATFATAAEFLEDPQRNQVDCVVVDMRMPGLDGLKLQERLNQLFPDMQIVFLTGHGEVSASVRAMKAGAVDFLEKPVDDKLLLAAIDQAAEKSRHLRTARQELEILQRRFSNLTPRERQVFEFLTKGLLNKQIGAELGTAEKTIKVHRARVREKMKAQSLADLVRMAERLGIGSKECPI